MKVAFYVTEANGLVLKCTEFDSSKGEIEPQEDKDCGHYSRMHYYDDHIYGYITNPYSGDIFGSFNHCIKDAIKAIREGYGDSILMSDYLFGKRLKVAHFMDREYGEKMRQKTLEGFKDAKFCYVLAVRCTGTIRGLYRVSSDGNIYFGHDDKFMKFDSKEKANDYISFMQTLINNEVENIYAKCDYDVYRMRSESEGLKYYTEKCDEIEKEHGYAWYTYFSEQYKTKVKVYNLLPDSEKNKWDAEPNDRHIIEVWQEIDS